MAPADQLEETVMEFARAIAANAPLSVKAAKLIVNEAAKLSAEPDLDLCRQLVEDCYASEDYVEGQKAFAEKRPPNYKGR